MLFCGRKLTAQEACSRGLVSQVFWPTTFNQEVMLRVKEMASCSAVVGPSLRLQRDERSWVRPPNPSSPSPLCLKGSRRIQMPGEMHCHVSPGGGQWEGVPDAEAALVFNQRTWSTLQLSAQVMWQVIREGWERSAVASITRLEFPLLMSVIFVRVCEKTFIWLTCVQIFIVAVQLCTDEGEVQSQFAGNNQDVQSELIYLS